MKNNKLVALAMSGAMLMGTFATAMPVMADDTSATTTVKLEVTKSSATYELSIPATLEVKNSGYNELAGGITVRNLDNATDVTSINVTAESTNMWSLVYGSNTIPYKLVSSDDRDTLKISYSFENKDSMSTESGQTKECGINVDDYSNAVEGNYSDTITWTASVVKSDSATASLTDMFKDGATIELGITCDGVSYVYQITNSSGNAVVNEYTVGDELIDSDTSKVNAYLSSSDKTLDLRTWNSYGYDLLVYADTGKYVLQCDNSNAHEATLNYIKVNGGSEYKLTKIS